MVETNLPFHDDFRVTAIYGQVGPMWSLGFHTGIDLVADSNISIYANCNGTVYSKGFSSAYGNHVYIYDSVTGYYHHFCHMKNPTTVEVGYVVNRNTYLGEMGATGNVTGPHLHYELMINSTQFVAENFIDPTIWLGIPNVINHYNWQDYPIGPTPPPTAEWIYKDEYLNQTEKENNATVIYYYLKGTYNLNNKTIGALLGNMDAESTLEPWLTERGATNPRLWFSTAYTKTRFN